MLDRYPIPNYFFHCDYKTQFLTVLVLADPLSMSPQKALEAIGSNLQKQYERWQPRARYKPSLDPTAEEVQYENSAT